METVLVTGGTGFIGLHCLQQLLDKGYKVRTTIRSESRKQEVMDAMKKHSSNCENLEFFIADLLSDDGWSEAVTGSKYVLHVASPFFLGEPENEDVFRKKLMHFRCRWCALFLMVFVIFGSYFCYDNPSELEEKI